MLAARGIDDRHFGAAGVVGEVGVTGSNAQVVAQNDPAIIVFADDRQHRGT